MIQWRSRVAAQQQGEPGALTEWLWRRFLAVFGATLLLSSADAVLVAARAQPTLGLLGRYWLLGAGIGVWVAVLAAFLLTPGHLLASALQRAVTRPSARSVLWGMGYALFAACGSALLLRPWELSGDSRTYRPIVALLVLVVVVALTLSLLWQRAPRWASVVAATLAAVCEVADAGVLVSVYPRWHDVAGWLALLLATSATTGLLHQQSRERLKRLSLLAVLLQVCWWVSARAVVELGAERGIVVPKLVAVARWFTDRDGDRFSGVLAGGDCDDSNGEVFPGQCEIAGNGVDDNCNGMQGAVADRVLGKLDLAHSRGESAAASSLRTPRPDVYFVLLDGARADFAGMPRGQLAPEIERFAEGALDFTNAYTTYPSTFRAIATLQTSRYWRYLGRNDETFAALLARAGWDAQLLIRDQVFRDFAKMLDLRRKDDPFHTRASGKESWTKITIDRAIAELAELEAPPRLRWLHLLDTHAPWLHGPASAAAREQYQAEIAHSSRHFGRLMDALQASDRGRRAVVVLLADHGMALGEHGAGTHGGTLYEELIHVPLLLRLPGVAPQRVEGLASLLDIVPTLATYLGLAIDPAWQGFSWLGCDASALCSVLPAGPSPRVVAHLQASAAWGYAGLPALDAASDGRYKLLIDLDRGRRMFFDLERDPNELNPLAEPPADALWALEKALSNWEDLSGCANRL
jgi:arylsulfatase A-like enzyme